MGLHESKDWGHGEDVHACKNVLPGVSSCPWLPRKCTLPLRSLAGSHHLLRPSIPRLPYGLAGSAGGQIATHAVLLRKRDYILDKKQQPPKGSNVWLQHGCANSNAGTSVMHQGKVCQKTLQSQERDSMLKPTRFQVVQALDCRLVSQLVAMFMAGNIAHPCCACHHVRDNATSISGNGGRVTSHIHAHQDP